MMDSDKDNLTRILQELQNSVREGDLENTRNIINGLHQNLAHNKKKLSELHTSGIQCTTQTDLILAACQSNKAHILYYILKEADILTHLTDGSFDDAKVNKKRTEAVKHALSLEDFSIIEMLYDFWCGNLHWSGHDIKSIEMVGYVFKNACDTCPIYTHDLQLPTDSLITFNAFQREIYTELAKLDRTDLETKPEESANMIIKVLSVYHTYSKIEMVRINHKTKEQEKEIPYGVSDEKCSSVGMLEHILYGEYFRKLDFNVSLLIMENLYVIRKHLKIRFNKTENYFLFNPDIHDLYKNAAEKYGGIESALYNLIYRTSEDRRLYATEMRLTLKQEKPEHLKKNHEGRLKDKKNTLQAHKFENAAIIFFERENFKTCFDDLILILKEHVLKKDLALVGTQNKRDHSRVKKLLNENYLQTISYMRDHYSLIKVVYYLEAIENTTDNNVLMIERALHVVGEMLKSSRTESHHLSRSTEALLQTAISVETISHLQHIRFFLSYTHKGQLSTRIDMANTQAQRFEDIKQELIIIKQIINYILDIVKPILDKSLLENGLRILEQRLDCLPELKTHFNEIHSLSIPRDGLRSELYNLFVRDIWNKTKLTLILLQEIAYILANKAQIVSKIKVATTRLSTNVVSILPLFIQDSRQMLVVITENNKYVKEINQKIHKYIKNVQMPDCPNEEEIDRVKNKVEKLMISNENFRRDLNKIKNYKIHWESVKGMLSFFLSECELFATIKVDLTDTTTVAEAYTILADLEAVCVKEKSNFACNSLILNKRDFRSIERLHKDQIDSNNPEPSDPRLAREITISCLVSRLDLLKQTLSYEQKIPPSQLMRIFDHDMKFRMTIEMILADISSVWAESYVRLMNKSSMLLRHFNLTDVLGHSNSFLEVIGDIFNSHDLAAVELDKAMIFSEDAESIKALYELFRSKMEYRTILAGDLLTMDDQQKQLHAQLKKSPNWESYGCLTRYAHRRVRVTSKTSKDI